MPTITSPGAAGVAFLGIGVLAMMGGSEFGALVWFGLCGWSIATSCAEDGRPKGILATAPVEHGNLGVAIMDRTANERRDRERAMRKLCSLRPGAFRRRFKVNRGTFFSLADAIRHVVEPDQVGRVMATRSSGSHIPAELQLAASLRWLAGANHMCQQDNYEVGVSSFYECLWRVVYALDCILPDPVFNPQDANQMASLARNMHSRSRGTMAGCVGALDGMAIRIKRPQLKDCPNPALYKNRKGFYSINLQAIADADRRFLWWSMLTVGSTHDSLAWGMTALAEQLREMGLPGGYWLAGDDAYVANEYMVTPYSTLNAKRHRDKDSFNFFQSRCRINVECAFGILVEKFGCLRRPLGVTLAHTTTLVFVLMKLHNVTVDQNVQRIRPLRRDVRDHDSMMPIKQDRVSFAPRDYKKRVKSDIRESLCKTLELLKATRPINHRKRPRLS